MDISYLLENSNVQEKELKKYITTKTANELMELSKPCYSPPFKKEYNDLLHLIGLQDLHFTKFTKEFYPVKNSKMLILRDNGTNVLLFIMHYFLLKKDQQSFLSTLIYLNIKFYGSRFHRHFKVYCDPNYFTYALDNLPKNHLFVREKTIANSLFYLGKELARKHQKEIEEFSDTEKILDFVYECRTRVQQSMRSFAQAYFRASESGTSYKENEEFEGHSDFQSQQQDSRQKIATTISQQITIYKHIDQKAFNAAKDITKINFLTAEYLVKSMNDIKYTDDIRIIIELFLREIKDKKDICGKDFYNLVQKLMSIKKTNQPIYFKQQITTLTCKLIKSSKNVEDKYNVLAQQTKFFISVFVAYYLTLVLRNKVC